MRQKLLTLALASLTAITASAAPMIGDELFITGSVQIDANSADFFPLGGINGDFNVEDSSTGFFASLVDPGDQDDGNITDLTEPVGTAISVNPFLTFDMDSAITFELTRIDNGSFVPCISTPVCSVNQFNLVQAGTAVIANFNVSGNVLENGVVVNRFTGSFSQAFNNQTIAGLLGQVGQAGFINSAFDGNFKVSAIPEPGTTSLFLIGGALVASRLVRRKRA